MKTLREYVSPAEVSSRDALAPTPWRPHGVASTRAMQCKEGRNEC
jgi:hypothetical protein